MSKQAIKMNRVQTRAAAHNVTHMLRLLFVLFLGFGAIFATNANAQSYVFNTVQIDGNQRVEDGTILSFAGISRGISVSAGELNDAVQRIRNSGLFETVVVTPRGRTLVINVTERPTVNRISVEGNAKVRDADLLGVVGSQARRVYSPEQAERDTAAIAQVYASKGRINAIVRPSIIRRSDNRVDLVFTVVEAGVTEIERISFVGNRTYSEGRLRRVLQTKQAGILRAIISRDTFVEDRIAFDRRALTDFYHSRGYVDFQVQNVDVALTRERDAYLVTFNVQEGQKFTFGNVTLTSDIPEADAQVFRDELKLRTGVVYSPALVDREIARLERLALRLGLNFVQVDPRITRNDRELALDIEFKLVRGQRIFVERIDIEGNNTTLDRVVRNQFRIVEGDPFNPRSIRESAERIRALGFFANSNVAAREGSSANQVIIDVDVEEGNTGSLSFGANYNSDTGLGLVASFRQSNFLGRGQSVNFKLSTAESNRVLTFSFQEPQFLGRDLGFGLNLDYSTTDNENALYDTETFRFKPSLTFPVSENGRLQLFYAYSYEDITDVGVNASALIAEDAGLGGIGWSSIGYGYSFDTRRTGLNPNAGVVFRFGQEFGFGDAQYIKTTALAAAETKVLNEEVTLRATIEGGYLDYTKGQSRITDRFFLGSRLMRGFEAGGIGPRDEGTDDALGGNVFAVARLEAEFPIGLPSEYGISGGAFIDYGSVWDIGRAAPVGTTLLYDDFTARTVAGLSVFWDTPIGPLRFNFSEALDAQAFDTPKNFDVTISTSF
ncbi:MAG: outer membrane protein insertion porin family [Gammaproteobacteria bacterium]|jgi:outer membrane protein insertion porin family